MLIVDIVGGLGNQMYCYALYRTLLERGRNVYMNISSFRANHKSKIVAKRNYELSNVFNITERIISSGIPAFMYRALRKLHIYDKIYQDTEEGFQPEVLEAKSGFCSGYWQSFKYSESIQNILRKEFTFKKQLTGKSAEVIDEIRNCNSVSIHIRRGDYIKLGWALPEDYYAKAIKYIQERISDAKFFCISDDIKWCKNKYVDMGTKIKFIDWTQESENQDFDMRVISECKHNILANSTFSIWGAWLNQNKNRITIRPEKISLSSKNKDIWPSEWIVLQ